MTVKTLAFAALAVLALASPAFAQNAEEAAVVAPIDAKLARPA